MISTSFLLAISINGIKKDQKEKETQLIKTINELNKELESCKCDSEDLYKEVFYWQQYRKGLKFQEYKQPKTIIR